MATPTVEPQIKLPQVPGRDIQMSVVPQVSSLDVRDAL